MDAGIALQAPAPKPEGGGAADPVSTPLFGFRLTPFTQAGLIDFATGGRGPARRTVVVSLNMHGLYMYIRDPQVRALHDRADTFQRIDGAPIVWLAAAAGLGLGMSNRIPWNDMLLPLLEAAEARGRRVFYVGSSPEVLGRASALIRRACPRIVLGGRDGYFDATPGSAENRALLEAIDAFRPDLLIVGMGMPRQERWIAAHLDRLNVPVTMTCGAAMEVLAGDLPKPPAFVSRNGLEGLYRLAYSPRRTWRRYLAEPWTVLAYVLRHARARPGGVR